MCRLRRARRLGDHTVGANRMARCSPSWWRPMTPVCLFSTWRSAPPNGLGDVRGHWPLVRTVGLCADGGRHAGCPAAASSDGGLSGVVVATLRSSRPVWLAADRRDRLRAWSARGTVHGRRAAAPRAHDRGAGRAVTVAAALAGIWWTRHSAPGRSVGPGRHEATSDPGTSTLRRRSHCGSSRRSRPSRAGWTRLRRLVYVTSGWSTLALITRRVHGATPAASQAWNDRLSSLTAVTIPVVITAVTVASAGPLWQGRYGLPVPHRGDPAGGGAPSTRQNHPGTALTGPLACTAGRGVCLALGQATSLLGVFADRAVDEPVARRPRSGCG